MTSFSNLFSRSSRNLSASPASTPTISGPTGFRHESHIGWDKDRGFEVQNIPADWQKIFAAAGIKKRELKNPETAAFVMQVVSAAAPPSSVPSGPSPSLDPQVAAATRTQPASGGMPAAPARPHRPAPPPPGAAPPSSSAAAPPPPPPPPPASGSGSGSRIGSNADLLAAIRQGKELRPVVVPDLAKMAPEESDRLVGALQTAMAARRSASLAPSNTPPHNHTRPACLVLMIAEAIAPTAGEESNDEDEEDWAVEA